MGANGIGAATFSDTRKLFLNAGGWLSVRLGGPYNRRYRITYRHNKTS